MVKVDVNNGEKQPSDCDRKGEVESWASATRLFAAVRAWWAGHP